MLATVINLRAVRGLGDSVSVLREREFRLLFAGQTVSLLGDGMVRVALPFAVLAIGGSASGLGAVLAAFALSLVGSLLIGGVVADRLSRRAVMVAADLVRLGSQGMMAVLVIAGSGEVWSLGALAALSGAATGFFQPALSGLTPAVVAPERLQAANGLRASSMSLGEIVGPAAAGVLVASAGAGWALAVDATTFGVSAAFLSLLRVPPRAGPPNASFTSHLADGWRAVRSRRWVWSVIFAVTLCGGFWAAFSALGPLVAERSLGGASGWGAVLSAMGAGALTGAVAAIGIRPRRPVVVVALSYTVFPLPLAFLAAGVSVVPLAAAAFLSGIGLTLGNTVWESTLQRRIPAEVLSRVSSYEAFGSLALRPIGLALWGSAGAAIGVQESLWLAFAMHVTAAAALLAVPEARAVERAPAAA